jgi:holo-[acyl-carrier protein] synthase
MEQFAGVFVSLYCGDNVQIRASDSPPHRFAAKEAAIKAHSHRRLTFHDIVIERRGREEERLGSGPPVARIKAGDGVDEDTSAMISISHDGDYATAVCMAHDPSVTNK